MEKKKMPNTLSHISIYLSGRIFDKMALYFDCRINKNALLHTVFFGDFAHWVIPLITKVYRLKENISLYMPGSL